MGLISSSMLLWQVPRGTYKQFCVSLSELQHRVMPCGEIGKDLFEQMVELNDRLSGNAAWPHGETWCLGDEGVVCALLQDVQLTGSYVMHPAPHVREGLSYEPGRIPGWYGLMSVWMCEWT